MDRNVERKFIVPDRIFERSAELWCRHLRRPRYDNGDNTPTGAIGLSMAVMHAVSTLSKIDDFEATIERFRVALIEKLKFNRDHDGEPTGRKTAYGDDEYVCADRLLSVDYDPCKTLCQAAAAAGLPTSLFPWKSDISFWDCAHVCEKIGYSGVPRRHYPLSGERWLVCDLEGSDMPKIIAAVEAGILTDFEIDVSGARGPQAGDA